MWKCLHLAKPITRRSMLRRALLTVAVISYLSCVLFLSGVQRNDSDSLRKLQKRNINIYDENNEELRREFLLNSSVANMKQMKIIRAPLRATPVPVPTTTLNAPRNKYAGEVRINGNVTRDRRTVVTDENVEESSVSIENDKNESTLIKNDSNGTLIEYTDGKPNLRNVINFWQKLVGRNLETATESFIVKNYSVNYTDFNTDINTDVNSDVNTDINTDVNSDVNTDINTDINSDVKAVVSTDGNADVNAVVNANMSTDVNTTDHADDNTNTEVTENYITTITSIATPKYNENKINIDTTPLVNNMESKEDVLREEYLNNILSEYTSKEESRMQIITTPRPKVISTIDDDTDIFNYLLNTNDKGSPETHKFNARLSKYSYEFKFSKIKIPIDKFKREEESKKMQRSRDPKPVFSRDFEDIEKNVFNNDEPTTTRYYISRDENHGKYNRDKKIGRNALGKPKFSKFKITDYKDEKPTSILPPEMIKLIAENVKDLIIRDLHKDVISTTKGITAVTTTRSTASNKNLIVIEKIMEILQKYKTENNIAEAPSTTVKSEKAIFHTTSRLPYHPKARSIKRIIKKTNSAPYSNPYALPQYKRVPIRSKIENPKQYSNPMGHSDTRAHSSRNHNSRPITIQSNLIEIPPLGVPVSNPVSLISHTIVISTGRPYIERLQMFPSRQHKLAKKKSKTAKSSNAFKHSKPKKKEHGGNKKRVTEYRPRSDEREDNEDEVRVKVHKRKPVRYEDVQRFHEKLEHYHESDGDLESNGEECCRDEIFTREQRPLNYMKSRNDASFKKLLKTQQRVTDMLEQMLARTKAEQPVSVETA